MSAPLTVPRDEQETSDPKPQSTFWKLTKTVVAVAVVVVIGYFGVVNKEKIQNTWQFLNAEADHIHDAKPVYEPPIPVLKPTTNVPWDGFVSVDSDEQTALGFRYAEVKAQSAALRLELTGRTAYDTNTITKVRPRFDTRIEKVRATIGEKVKKGAPLLDLYSIDLASAKTDFQTKWVQWQHDLKLKTLRQELIKTGAISQQIWVDTQNDEQKSRLDFTIAHDKLSVFYEIPESDLNPLLEHLSDKAVDIAKFGNNENKAMMTLKSKADGYVITRDVVQGNYYESTDVLMQIAPLDHLWVWVNVYEMDQDKVRVGQTMDVEFPFLAQTKVGRVNYVAPEVSKDTRAVQVRVEIPNPDAGLKADMLVKAFLEIPPLPGQTIIPRLAMVALSGGEYVFIRKDASSTYEAEPAKGEAEPAKEEKDETKDKVARFERIKIRVAQENTDTVIVADGLKPGQVIVTNGSLILAQLYEDQRMTVSGTPAQ